jgi:hypothetical protein
MKHLILKTEISVYQGNCTTCVSVLTCIGPDDDPVGSKHAAIKIATNEVVLTVYTYLISAAVCRLMERLAPSRENSSFTRNVSYTRTYTYTDTNRPTFW